MLLTGYSNDMQLARLCALCAVIFEELSEL